LLFDAIQLKNYIPCIVMYVDVVSFVVICLYLQSESTTRFTNWYLHLPKCRNFFSLLLTTEQSR